MREELRRDIDKFVEENYDNIFRDIGRLVAINSVQTEAKENMPFGEGPAAALELGLEISRELGLETKNCENMLGYSCVGGHGDKYLATITHLDIVPEGEGWSASPFVMREREGYVIGRGVLDDKGPSVLCLYALKYLKDRNVELKYPVRALLGLAEETGMEDVEYYLENYPAPLFCFSPDANFPLCNGEKGIYHGRMIASEKKGDTIVDIRGGIASNVIPGKAEAWVKTEKLVSSDKVDAELIDGVWHLTAHGIGGHASQPEGTENAIGVLAQYLVDNVELEEADKKFMNNVIRLNSCWRGKGIGVDKAMDGESDGRFDGLTIVGGVIGVEDGYYVQSLDSRYPTNTSGERIAKSIEDFCGGDVRVTIDHDAVPFYMELDNPAVQVCINAYNEITGENAEPYTIGGGTYARHFPNAVSFGPEHEDREQPAFAGPIHGADEAANKEWFIEALKVYILALIELEKIDF